jgi:hypothetical protein
MALVFIASPILIGAYRNTRPKATEPARVFPPCAPAQDPEKLSDPERKALAHSMEQTAKACTRSDTRCGFAVESEAGKIHVHVDFFVQDPRNGVCGQSPGGFAEREYDAAGNFVVTNPGI